MLLTQSLKVKIAHEGIKVSDDFFKNIQKYKEHLFKWNKIHNLTGARTEKKVDYFIFDALFPITFFDFSKTKTALDIGTGAGFPGLILAMALPDIHFTLAEPLQKRASFLQFIKADLKLSNVTVEQKRVEDIAPSAMDLITSRAVMKTTMLLDLAKDFIMPSTQILFYKGENVFDEVKEAHLNYEVIETQNRHYLLIQQQKS